MRGKSIGIVAVTLLALMLSMPAWAVELTLSGTYEISGRYFDEPDLVEQQYAGAQARIGSTGVYYITSYAVAGDPVVGTIDGLDMEEATELDPFVPTFAIKDRLDEERYLYHVFTLRPEIEIMEDVKIKAEIGIFDNKLSDDDYGKQDWEMNGNPYDPRELPLDEMYGKTYGYEKDWDSYTIPRVEKLWAEVLTPVGMFIFGRGDMFTGIGWFIQIPQAPGWTYGLIWSKEDEEGADYLNNTVKPFGNYDVPLDTDSADEDGVALLCLYESDWLTAAGMCAYGWVGDDNAAARAVIPEFMGEMKKNGLTFIWHAKTAQGVFGYKDSGALKTNAYAFKDLDLGLNLFQLGAGGNPVPGQNVFVDGMFKDDWEFGGYSAYIDARYDIDLDGVTVSPLLSLAYASGAEDPIHISGFFNDDETFGTWLMNDMSDKYNMYFETPVSDGNDALGDPKDDMYSFTNIQLARLGLAVAVNEKLDIETNFIYALRANNEYLENWNPEWGIINAINQDVTKISAIGQVDPRDGVAKGSKNKNKVGEEYGWEVNAKVSYDLIEPFNVALQASYFQPGDFYETAFEEEFGSGAEFGYGKTGLEVQPEWAVRWIGTLSF